MIDPVVLPSFLVALAVILLVPGPDMAFMVAAGLEGGRPAAVRAALGITTGVSVYVVVTALGLGVVLSTRPALLAAVQVGGALYLLNLAYTTWRARASGQAAVAPKAQYFRRGFVVNLLNPKIAVFFAAFLPQFVVPGRGPIVIQLVTLGVLLQLAGLGMDLVVGVAAGGVRRRILDRPHVEQRLVRAAACVYAVLALVVLVGVAAG